MFKRLLNNYFFKLLMFGICMTCRIMAIDESLREQIENMQKKIKEIFNIEISKVKASKIIAYKNKSSNLNLTEKKLLEILLGKDVKK